MRYAQRQVAKHVMSAVTTVGVLLFVFSLFGSIIKAGNEDCGKQYYADYVIFTDLFCEVTK